jgi:serine protease inhibitor
MNNARICGRVTLPVLTLALVACESRNDGSSSPPVAPGATSSAPTSAKPPVASSTASAAQSATAPSTSAPPASTEASDQKVPANKLTSVLASSQPDANLALSNYSIERALGVLALGAGEVEAKELGEYLRSKDPNDFARDVQKAANNGIGKLTFKESLTVWVDQSFTIADKFAKGVTNAGGNASNLPFATQLEKSRERINAKISTDTAGKIPSLLPAGSLDPLTRLVVTSALSFVGNWATPFDPKRTSPEEFKPATGPAVRVPMMHAKGNYIAGTYKFEQSQGIAVRLPYKESSYELVLIQPNEALTTFETTVSTAKIAGVSAAIEARGQVQLVVPKFEVRSKFELKSALAGLGLKAAMAPSANYTGMVKGQDLFVSKIAHEAWLKVDEVGTEATAATAVVMGVKSVSLGEPTIVRIDKPFFYAVVNSQTGLLLFQGHVNNPATAAN